ncbi:uncharacterized protein BDR25DRAFT_20233 [Lindgomyces ingoldianus]|uniref:Uncharacterized protein n=1 Tax=Lindgomyces ingoldianus TaxID=673940 RepID=A0ACB6R1I7_9PLEO|nr:uncharacterized protein BDR25DRAFT_20233 [Lindgomyces ingoldianus]KAF2472311.1 hypothetical protein BDR25DRAFT_20233 [Lindgomyces ingoldianus]
MLRSHLALKLGQSLRTKEINGGRQARRCVRCGSQTHWVQDCHRLPAVDKRALVAAVLTIAQPQLARPQLYVPGAWPAQTIATAAAAATATTTWLTKSRHRQAIGFVLFFFSSLA